MSSIPISKEGFQALEQELDRLKKERPHVIQAIKEATTQPANARGCLKPVSSTSNRVWRCSM